MPSQAEEGSRRRKRDVPKLNEAPVTKVPRRKKKSTPQGPKNPIPTISESPEIIAAAKARTKQKNKEKGSLATCMVRLAGPSSPKLDLAESQPQEKRAEDTPATVIKPPQGDVTKDNQPTNTMLPSTQKNAENKPKPQSPTPAEKEKILRHGNVRKLEYLIKLLPILNNVKYLIP